MTTEMMSQEIFPCVALIHKIFVYYEVEILPFTRANLDCFWTLINNSATAHVP